MRRIATRFSFLFFFLPLVLSAKAFVVENTLTPSRAYLGIYSEEVSKQKAALLGADNPHGSYITRILPGSAAAKAGLKPLDYVVGVDQHKVDEDTDLSDILDIYEAGTEATLHLYRQGKAMQVKITFGEKSKESDDAESRPFLGVSPMDDEEDEDDAIVGVAVEVTEGSAAATMGLQDGDVITAMNGFTMIDWVDLSAVIRSLEPEAEVKLTIRRNGETLTKTGKMGKKSAEGYTRISGSNNGSNFGISWSGNDNKNYNWSRSEQQTDGAFLGVNLGSMSKEKAKKLGFANVYGTYVSSVIPNSAAAKAGMQPFDYIYGVDEYRVGEGQGLSFILRKFSPGQKANVYFIRKSQERNVSVTLGSHDDNDEDEEDWRDECEKPFLGVRQSHESYNDRGVLVDIVENSTAKEIGMKDGDILIGINGYPIIDWSDITTALRMIKANSNVAIDYLREGKKVSTSKAIKSICDARKSTSYYYSPDDKDNKGNSGTLVFKTPVPQSPRVNPANVKASMQDLEKADADKLKSQGLNISAVNNLRVEKINLYPNSGKGTFKLQFDLPEKGQTEVKVFNSAGRTIYEYELGNFTGDFSDEVDISQNGIGTYFLQIRQGDKYAAKKIVLQ